MKICKNLINLRNKKIFITGQTHLQQNTLN